MASPFHLIHLWIIQVRYAIIADPTRWLIVDGTPPKDELADTILTQVCERLQITLS